jgi:hypothetical protein
MPPDVDPALNDAHRRVKAETERFRAALPALLENQELRDRWVVFKDGAVARPFDDPGEGYRWAVENLGRYSGFVLARVEPEREYHLGGAAGFRFDPDDT